MLHIILMILKIIGFVVLALLGLLLLSLLTILLVPIRYRLTVEHGEALYVKGRAHWLLHIVHAGFSYIGDKLHVCVRLFGFVVYDNLKPKKPKIKKKKLKKKRVKRSSVKPSVKKRTSGKTRHDRTTALIDIKSPLVAGDNTSEGKAVDSRLSLEQTEERVKEAVLKEKEKCKDVITDSQNNRKQDENKRYSEKKQTFLEKLSERFHEIKDKLISGVTNLITKIKNFFIKLMTLKHKGDLIYDFIRDELNRQAFSVTFASVKRLLKHILPTKLESKIIFGTGDPCSTGQLLGVMSVFYGFYGDKVQITPDFESKRFEGKHDARGRIRMITILIIAVKLILDERFKQLKRNFTLLKEAL